MQIQVNNFSMAYSESGKGTPALFIHGYPLSRQLWNGQLQELSATARILAPDLRGFGESAAAPGLNSVEGYADDLDAFLDALEITQPVVVCGHSMGGYIAFACCRKFAQRIDGLILTATRAGADSAAGKAGRDQAAELARQKGAAALIEGMTAKLLSPKSYASKPELVAQVREIMESSSLEGVLGALSAMKERPDSTPTLGQIQVPTLVIHGADDPLIPLSEAQAMAAAIPGARLEIIPEVGHLPNLEDPEAFNQAVRNFLGYL